MGLADQPGGRALIGHDAGGRGVQPHLALEPQGPQRVGGAEARPVRQAFRGEEQRHAARARRRAGQAGEHEVRDVLRRVVVAPGDVDLLAGQAEGPVGRGFGPRRQRADIRAGAGLGEVHGAGPAPGAELRQPARSDPVRRMGLQGIDMAHAQQQRDRQRQVGPAGQFDRGAGPGLRQPGPAMGRVGGQPRPAARADGGPPGGEPRGQANRAVAQPRALAVAGGVERGEHAFRQPPGLGQDGVAGLRRRLGEARQGGQPVGPRQRQGVAQARERRAEPACHRSLP